MIKSCFLTTGTPETWQTQQATADLGTDMWLSSLSVWSGKPVTASVASPSIRQSGKKRVCVVWLVNKLKKKKNPLLSLSPSKEFGKISQILLIYCFINFYQVSSSLFHVMIEVKEPFDDKKWHWLWNHVKWSWSKVLKDALTPPWIYIIYNNSTKWPEIIFTAI